MERVGIEKGATCRSPLQGLCVGVFMVGIPLDGIGLDVFTDVVPFFFIANDVIVIISLPDRRAWGISYFVHLFGNRRFESSYDSAQGLWGGTTWSLLIRLQCLQGRPAGRPYRGFSH